MDKNRLTEVAITLIFIISLLLNGFFGFLYFAGLKYVPPIIKIVSFISVINIYLGLFYFVYRFIKWVIRRFN